MKPEAIVEAARERMDDAVNADLKNRELALDDLQFLAGWQWQEDERTARETEGRPVITINRLPQFVRQVTGDIRKLNPAVKVFPADDAATPDVAEVYEGLIRGIEYRSDASSVYEGAAESAAQCGMGAFRILTDYESDDSFDQEISIRRIENPFSVYWDPSSRMPTREDAKFCFVTEQLAEAEFKRQFPGKSMVDAQHDGQTDGLQHWYSGGAVIVAEYFWLEPVKKRIGQLADGRVVEDPVEGMNLVRTRTVEAHKVMWAKVSGQDVLDGPAEIPCDYIPVVAVIGEEMHVGEEVVRSSVIRFAKDAQKLYNYWRSAQTEVVALQPKSPYLVTAKQVRGLEDFWAAANDSNRPYLPYNPDEAAPPPQRIPPPVPSSAMMQEVASAAEDMKATTGIYDAGLGARSNEQSGVAIRQRQLESDISTSIYTDNLAKSIAHCGRILVSMIPRVYDTARNLRMVTDDGAEKMVPVNGMDFDLMSGAVPVNPLADGRYDVRVSVGPNYTTRRQETQEGMIQFVQAFPQAATVAGDLLAKAMDWPDADKLAERLRKLLPPGMIAPDEMTPEEQQQQMQAQQMQQMQMQMAAQMQQAEMAKTMAGAAKDEAGAEKAKAEAAQTQLETLIQSGQVQSAIQAAVQQALLSVLR